jgi:hypothetical protein
MAGKRKVLRAAIPADLVDKIYKAEGWTKVRDEVRTRRCKEVYDFSVDRRVGRYIATPKAGIENF